MMIMIRWCLILFVIKESRQILLFYQNEKHLILTMIWLLCVVLFVFVFNVYVLISCFLLYMFICCCVWCCLFCLSPGRCSFVSKFKSVIIMVFGLLFARFCLPGRCSFFQTKNDNEDDDKYVVFCLLNKSRRMFRYFKKNK